MPGHSLAPLQIQQLMCDLKVSADAVLIKPLSNNRGEKKGKRKNMRIIVKHNCFSFEWYNGHRMQSQLF